MLRLDGQTVYQRCLGLKAITFIAVRSTVGAIQRPRRRRFIRILRARN